MPTLFLRFAIILEDRFSEISPVHGPLFHRWLPDGEKDAITLDTGDPNSTLKVWFDRRGYVDGNWIRFDYKRKEVDANIMNSQAVLDAGPLRGQLEIGLEEEEMASIHNGRIGDENYLALGKRVILDLIYLPVSRFINLLRINYGQYWIKELGRWDSRNKSLGAYCNEIQLEWSSDSGKTWSDFVPDEPVHSVSVNFHVEPDYRVYLTEEEWHKLDQTLRTAPDISPAAFILSRTCQLRDQGDIKTALIEGVTALEIALVEFMRLRVNSKNFLSKELQSFWGLPLISRVVSVGASLGVSSQDLEYTVRSIKIRHEVIHEGRNPTDQAATFLLGLLNTIAALLSGPGFRFPKPGRSNYLLSPDRWHEYYKERDAKRSQR